MATTAGTLLMIARDRNHRPFRMITGALTVLALATACTGHASAPAAAPERTASVRAASPSGRSIAQQAAVLGTAGTYQVSEQRLTFVEAAHTGPAGQYLARRALVTDIRFPRVPRPARGPFPLILFAPGFMQCDSPYADLLDAWASAGYVVAAVNFPRTDCRVGAAAYEPDLVNQPGDMSYALTRLLALSSQPGDVLSGMLSGHRIAAAGQSDSADTVNPPWTSLQLYSADRARARYYLDLFGATHTVPYWGTNRVERVVARVTLAFFDRYVLGDAGALATMTRDGNIPGAAALVSGGRLPPS